MELVLEILKKFSDLAHCLIRVLLNQNYALSFMFHILWYGYIGKVQAIFLVPGSIHASVTGNLIQSLMSSVYLWVGLPLLCVHFGLISGCFFLNCHGVPLCRQNIAIYVVDGVSEPFCFYTQT